MSRKARWAPRLVPEVRRSMVASSRDEADRLAKIPAHGAERARLDAAAASVLEHAESLRRADLFWVTEDMARVVFDAASDVPSLDATTAPCLRGLICFQAPLPPWEPPPGFLCSDAAIPIDGVAWDTSSADAITLHLLAKVERLPRPLVGTEDKHLASLVTVTAPRHSDFDSTVVNNVGGQARRDPVMLSITAFIASCWALMMTPTVAERRSLDSRTGAAATPSTPPGFGVSIIDLRPLRYVEVDSEEGTGRRLTVRHVVRGHWTHQAHGPGRAERRLQWIAPYIKGPSWAPLLATDDRVMVWRRE